MSTQKIHDDYIHLLWQFPLLPLGNQDNCDAAIALMKELALKGDTRTSGEDDYLAVLTLLIADYERRFPLAGFDESSVSPCESVRYLMEEHNLTQVDVAGIAGTKQPHISAFLHGKRDLSKNEARNLARYFKLSIDVFLRA